MKVKRQNRPERLEAEIQKAMHEIITERLKNPLITGLITVSRVEASRDLTHAKVYISIYDKDAERKKTCFSEIVASTGKIRHNLGCMVNTRVVPELDFVLDDSMEYSDRINKLFKEINGGE